MLSFPLVGPVARRGYLLGAVTDDGVSIKVTHPIRGAGYLPRFLIRLLLPGQLLAEG